MSLAIEEAWKYQLLTYPNPAVGATVVKNSQILAVEAHKEAGKPHAEVLALKAAYQNFYQDNTLENLENSFEIHEYLIKNHKGFFHDCEIYVTLEPCNHIGKTPACANLIKELKPKKVYIGCIDPNNEATGGISTLINSNIDVEYNILKEECENLLFPFLSWNKSKFKFFKMAQTLNGTVDGGYITSNDSLKYVHQIREKLDLLVVGGNTVRIDKPTLDCRFSNQTKAPNVLIYSRKKEDEFDKSINLFKIKNRKVFISNNINVFFNENKFIMFEGIYNLLNEFYNELDMILVFISPKIKNGLNTSFLNDLNFEIIHVTKIGEDRLFWMKKLTKGNL